MQTSKCSKCNQVVYFENIVCVNCKSPLAFDPSSLSVVALKPLSGNNPDNFFEIAGNPSHRHVRYCMNAVHGACNWLTDSHDQNGLCRACDLNRTIPDLSTQENLLAWKRFENAKKRLIYTFLRFGLPFDHTSGASTPISFDFKDDAVTGHLNGLITIDMEEADAVTRERQRQQFDEPFRTLLAHLRHECGHYFWSFLAASSDELEKFRVVFGDETLDYTQALDSHYAGGPKPDWQHDFVSAYASSHPWEDWAETWAHYLHMVDALETAESVHVEPHHTMFSALRALLPLPVKDIYRTASFESLIERWVTLSVAMNSLNRSIGHHDFYPVVLPAAAHKKFKFIHEFIRRISNPSKT